MKRIKNIALLNTISNVILQVFTIINGFLIPKIILSYFGSEVNGLVSSLNQFLSCISLLEGGVTGVIMANLYSPLYHNNMDKVSSILKTTDKFYKKISIFFVIYTIILAIVYPLFFNVYFDNKFVFYLTLVLSLNLFIQYTFSLTYKTLLNADKKVYIVSFSQTIIIIFNIILAFISVKIFPNIIFMKFITGILYILQPIIYGIYVNKNYKIDKNATEDTELLKSRWNGFAINIASFIHFSTDITILSIFTDLKTVSIYSVYALVSNGLRQLIMSLANGITPSIGHLYASNKYDELNQKFDLFELIMFFIIFLLFSVSFFMITPFVLIYTNNIYDTNYNQPIFGILLLIAEGLYLLKYHHLNLAYSANKFKEITIPSYIEAILNIVISLVLVQKLGLIGIAIGTIVAMTYRIIFQVKYTKKIINRKQSKFYKLLILYIMSVTIGGIICNFIPAIDENILSWVLHGIIYTIIMIFVLSITSIIFYNKEVKLVFKKLRRGE